MIGDETELEITQKIQMQDAELEFKLEELNLCPTHGVHLIIKEGKTELLNEKIVDFSLIFNLSIPSNSIIEINTKIFPLEKSAVHTLCKIGGCKVCC